MTKPTNSDVEKPAARKAKGSPAAKAPKKVVAANKTPAPPSPMVAKPDQPKGKIGQLIDLLKADGGASIEVMMTATGWQAHSVRGAMAGSIKKKLGLNVVSEKRDGVRFYSIAPEPKA